MTLTPTSDESLYELALEADPTLPILQVSPVTLKAAFSGLIELLIDRELPAVVWAKLPRGAIWQAELERYSALEGIPRAIYVFKNHREESADESSLVSRTLVDTTTTAEPEARAVEQSKATPPAWLEILLAPESHLRREYFLLVWTAHFRGCILAHRPRSAQLAKAAENNVVESLAGLTDVSLAGAAIDDGQERRQHLLILSSFDGSLVERLLSGLTQVLMTSATLPNTAAPTDAIGDETRPRLALPDVVAHWNQLTRTMPTSATDPAVWGQLLMKQIQRQEEMLQRNAIYRRQAELVEILQLQKEELLNALRSKADFINTVGQELRTPLTTIKTALSLLNSPSLKPPQRQRYLDLIAKECDRQSSLITSLLDLVQLDQAVSPTALETIRMSDIVPGVVSTYQPLAEEKGVKLSHKVPEDLPEIACMGNWLKQIVINLLHNGIKFTPTGGQVWVRAKQQGSYVNLEVRDTGVGMAPGELPKIFDRFYRIRQASLDDASGAGLGLTIVQQLLLHCGGSISVKSRPGEGSTFTVLLPIRAQAPTSS
ncbi:ATP-binding protein [Stenomitos frigidus]|uniref:histidine kinase n=1 Tax=Stenomitos frigidus ULC18 TaxID=2107698 RepID=A0A2T1E6E0_9CYAN|nr:ATP-binding protein [Stenomitos frigidus]PSB28317.1 histidine kinase [Stenomitos frigidus ULC18]